MFAIDGEYEAPCHIEPEVFESDDLEAQQRLCAGCRIQLICLDHALHYEQISGERLKGVRGGLTPAQRTNTSFNRIA